MASSFQASGLDAVKSYQFSFAIIAAIGFVCMMVPVFTINEKDYCESIPSDSNVIDALKSTFANKDFLNFVISDLSYWIALTIFQTGLLYYITTLLGMEETKFTVLFMLLGVLSFVFYPIVNIMAKKIGKKKLISISFVVFIISFIIPFFFSLDLPISPIVQIIIMIIIAAFPMAVFAILPNAIVADIAEYDANLTGVKQEGVFFAARTFMSKLGQMISMLVFPSLITIGAIDGATVGKLGVRLTGPVSALFLAIGLIFFLKYDEAKIIGKKLK